MSTQQLPSLSERFLSLLERHVSKLTRRGPKVLGCCPFHDDRFPSFTANIEKSVFYCFGCGSKGGVKKFAELVGEAFSSTAGDSRTARVHRALAHAEHQARAILQRRVKEQRMALRIERREVESKIAEEAYLLGLFQRRTDLAEEFSDVHRNAEQRYGKLLSRLSTLTTQIDGELA